MGTLKYLHLLTVLHALVDNSVVLDLRLIPSRSQQTLRNQLLRQRIIR